MQLVFIGNPIIWIGGIVNCPYRKGGYISAGAY